MRSRMVRFTGLCFSVFISLYHVVYSVYQHFTRSVVCSSEESQNTNASLDFFLKYMKVTTCLSYCKCHSLDGDEGKFKDGVEIRKRLIKLQLYYSSGLVIFYYLFVSDLFKAHFSALPCIFNIHYIYIYIYHHQI